jgi:cytochrome c oxidase subunit IV
MSSCSLPTGGGSPEWGLGVVVTLLSIKEYFAMRNYVRWAGIFWLRIGPVATVVNMAMNLQFP